MITVLLIVVFFAVLILGHEFGHFLAARLLHMEVQEFGFGLPPKIASKKIGKTEYSLNLIPFGGFVKVEDLEPVDMSPDPAMPKKYAPIWKRAIVFFSGVLVNFIIGWVAFSFIFMMGVPKAVYVSGLVADGSAAVSGIETGDRLVDFDSVDELTEFIKSHPEEDISWNIDRYGENIVIVAAPRVMDGVPRIGVELIESGFPKQGFFKSIGSGFLTAGQFAGKIFSALAGMFRHGDFSSSSGPISIFNAVSVAKDMGLAYFLQLMGIVSLNLMVINILPLPALDGGHLLFLAIEKIRRKPIGIKAQSAINSTSFILLLILMFVVTIRDIIRLF